MLNRLRWRFAGFLILFAILCAGEIAGAAFTPVWLGVSLAGIAWALLFASLLVALGDTMLHHASERMRSVSDLALRLSNPLELRRTLEAGLAEAVSMTGADAACLRLLGDNGELTVAATANVDPRHVQKNRSVPAGKGLALAALAEREPLRVTAEEAGPEFAAMLQGRAVREVILVPVVSEGKPQGLLTLAYSRGSSTRAATRDTLRAIAAQLAIAVVNGRLYEGLWRESRTDPLTGLGSRRHFEDLCRRELARANRTMRPLSLAMIDVDDFKQINDTWGHVIGDRVLQAVGELLRGVRAGDVVARYGGDEFVVLMPETKVQEAHKVIDRIRDRVTRLNGEGLFPFEIRLSIGVREMTSMDENLVAQADAAMYEEKQQQKARADVFRTGTDS